MACAGSKFQAALRGLMPYASAPPPERLWDELDRLVESFLRLEAENEDEERDKDYATADLAVLLFCMAAVSEEVELTLRILRKLVSLGVQGQILFVLFVEEHDPPFDETAGLVAELDSDLRFLLFDRLLMSPNRARAEFVDFALDVLTMLKDANPVEGIRLLERLKRHFPAVSFPVREALRRGAVGEHVARVLAEPGNRREVDEALDVLPVLRLEGTDTHLAELLDEKDEEFTSEVLQTLCSLPPRLAIRAAKPVGKLLGAKSRRVELCALETLFRLVGGRAGRVAASLFAKRPILKKPILARAGLMRADDFESFASSLSEKERAALSVYVWRSLARMDPVYARACLQMAVSAAGHEAAGEILGALIAAEETPAPVEAQPPKQKAQAKNLKDTSSVRLDLAGQYVASGRFEKVEFSRAAFAGTWFEKCVFRNCTFTDCDFSEAVFSQCTFTDCVVHATDCTRSLWQETSFSRVRLDRSFFCKACFSHCTFAEAAIEKSSMSRVLLLDSTLAAVRFKGLVFLDADLARLSVAGLEFEDCHLAACRLIDWGVSGARLTATTFNGCECLGLRTADPTLYRAMEMTREARLREKLPELESARPPAGLTRKALSVAGKAVDYWFRLARRAEMSNLFMSNNHRRLSWGMEKLEPKQAELFAMVPLVLHSDFFDRQVGLYPVAPPCRIAGYTPDCTTLEIARKYFPEAALPDPLDDAVPIEAIYTIGSLGTIAQSRDSDIDYWVCCRLEELAEQDVEGLNQKLELISEWAEKEFSMEVYFFLMDERSVRENNFGASGGESSGTAQALMLKEEFYRTAVYVAGKKPVWWLVPPGADQKLYDRTMEKLLGELGSSTYTDLGHVPAIPAAEFFGASLWQIVKAMKSPFKSIMKFGLLEKYTRESEVAGALLCDRIKENILAGWHDLWHIDPYVVLFLEVANYYAAKGERETVDLIKRSFFLKAKITREAAKIVVPRREEERSIRMLFSRTVGSEELNFKEVLTADEWNLKRLIESAGQINQFVINTYLKVREQQKEGQQAAIDPMDLTKLGRKIFSTFAPRKYKIDRLSFIKVQEDMVSRLFFSVVKQTKKGAVYEVQGGQLDQRTRRLDEVPLKRSHDLVWLFAWLVANKLFHPRVKIKVDYSLSPVIAKDVTELLGALKAFFPHNETFDTDIAENVRKERVVKAFFVLNLLVGREESEIKRVSVIYSTNWGEMFCKTMPVTEETLKVDPHAFLREHLEQDVDKAPAMDFFLPDRSNCPGILIL